MNKDKIKEYSIVFIVSFIISYFLGSFIAVSFDIMNWNPGGRALTVLGTILAILVYGLINELES